MLKNMPIENLEPIDDAVHNPAKDNGRMCGGGNCNVF